MNIIYSRERIEKLVIHIKHYRIAICIFLVVIVYGFIIFRGEQLSHVSPSQAAITSQTTNLNYPQINPTIINKINQLQDNSVNVQSLFNQARQNPFQE